MDEAGAIKEVTKCQWREDTEWVSAFWPFQCEELQSSLVAGSAGHEVHAFYVEKFLSLDRVGQRDVTRVVFEQALPCKVS